MNDTKTDRDWAIEKLKEIASSTHEPAQIRIEALQAILHASEPLRSAGRTAMGVSA